MIHVFRWLLGRRVSDERERRAAEVSQLRLDSDRTLRRAYAVLDAERRNLATATQNTAQALQRRRG